MEPKKISFSFNKPIKRTNVFANIPPPQTSKPEKELISCLEGQSIKLLNEKIKEPAKPLVIPLKEKTTSTAALISKQTRKDVLNGTDSVLPELKKPLPDSPPAIPENESIEQKAARELLEEIKEKNGKATEDASVIVPVKANDLPLDGAIGSTIEDYENIPVSQFGYAMIRGMGWEGVPKAKNIEDDEGPLIRPKGMGLGASKMLKTKQPLLPAEENETLQININSFVRILAGKYKDLYGQIEALDEDSGRLIIKLALKGNKESFDEFMVQPVSKSEYTQYAKVINSAKYEEYKKMENEHGQIIIKKEEKDIPIKTENVKVKVERDDDHTDDKRDDSDKRSRIEKSSHDYKSEDRKERSSHSKKSSRRHSSDVEVRSSSKHKEQSRYHDQKSRSRHSRDDHKRSESTDSESNSSKERTTKKKSKKHKSRDRSKHSRSPSDDDKRHKKKTKKSKRPRSRSKGRR